MFYEYAPDMKLHYETKGGGRPVLLIHGLGCDINLMASAFEPIFKKEDQAYKRIYIDLPGMGESSHTLAYASSDKILAILEGFVDKFIGQNNFLLIGQSYGGYLAQGLLAHYKFQIDGINLLCPMIVPDNKQRKVPKKYLSFANEDYLSNLDPQKADQISNNLLVANRKTAERWEKEVISGIKKSNKEFLKALKKNYGFIVDVDEVIKNLDYDKPSLIMTGRQDTIVGYKDQWHLLNILPRASFAVLDATDHNLQIEAPNIFNALVQNWLERLVKFA